MFKKIFNIIGFLNILGLLIVLFVLPDFIGEYETTLLDYISMKSVLILSIPTFICFVYGQIKYSLIIKESLINWLPLKILGSIILLPAFSFLFSFCILLNIYGISNLIFSDEQATLTGTIYKKDVHEVAKGPDNYYLYFNSDKQYKIEVDRDTINKYNLGDTLSLKTKKGSFFGYYIGNKQKSYKK